MEITNSLIAEYNGINAFATTRSRAIGHGSSLDDGKSTVVHTSDLNESLNLISGSLERLTTMESNLTSIYELAYEASLSTTTDDRKYEIFGQMRSLSAGIDQLVEQTTFNGSVLFQGADIKLQNGFKTNEAQIDGKDLTTTGKEGLGIATQTEGAIVDIHYDDTTEFLNTTADIYGLDIVEAKFTELGEGVQELQDGDYNLEVIYNGPDSEVILKDSSGIELSRAKNIDLTGSGASVVKFDVGLELTIEKEQYPDGVDVYGDLDKWDYENDGPRSLYANMTYERVYNYNLLSENENDYVQRSVKQSNGGTGSLDDLDISIDYYLGKALPIEDSEGNTLSLKSMELGGVSEDSRELETGKYKAEITYRGKNSYVSIYDSKGIIVSVHSKIDLSEEGEKSLDLGNGVVLKIDNEGFNTEETGNINTYFDYQQESKPYLDFDYDGYLGKLEDAINTIYEEEYILEQAQAGLNQSYQIQLAMNTGNFSSLSSIAGSTLSSPASNISNMLSSAITTTDPMLSVLSPKQAQSQLATTTSQISNSAASALSTQANQNSGIFNALM